MIRRGTAKGGAVNVHKSVSGPASTRRSTTNITKSEAAVKVTQGNIYIIALHFTALHTQVKSKHEKPKLPNKRQVRTERLYDIKIRDLEASQDKLP